MDTVHWTVKTYIFSLRALLRKTKVLVLDDGEALAFGRNEDGSHLDRVAHMPVAGSVNRVVGSAPQKSRVLGSF